MLAIGVITEHDMSILDHAHYDLLAAEGLVGLFIGRIPLAVRMFPGGYHAVYGFTQILKGFLGPCRRLIGFH